MKSKRNWLAGAFLTLLTLPMVIASILVLLQLRQDGLNQDLIQAIKHKKASQAIALLRMGANANSRELDDAPVTLWQAVQKRLQRPSVSLQPRGPTTLMLAVESGDADLVRTLLAHNAKGVNDREPIPNEDAIQEDRPLLLIATAQGNLPVAEVLLDHGADIHARNTAGKTALIDAIWDLEYAEDDRIHSHRKKELTRRLLLVKRLVERGADINACDSDGCTALFYAAQEDWPAMVKFLLDKGADPNRIGKTDNLPIFTAVDNSHIQCVKLLLEHGANPNEGEWDSRPLTDAAWSGDHEIVRLLLEYGADPTFGIKNAGSANGNDYSARFAALHERPFAPAAYGPIIQLLDEAVLRWKQRRR